MGGDKFNEADTKMTCEGLMNWMLVTGQVNKVDTDRIN